MSHIRWRLKDPAEARSVSASQRWSKVHRVSVHASDLTRCHVIIPEHTYMTDVDDQIPANAPRCKRCEKVDE